MGEVVSGRLRDCTLELLRGTPAGWGGAAPKAALRWPMPAFHLRLSSDPLPSIPPSYLQNFQLILPTAVCSAECVGRQKMSDRLRRRAVEPNATVFELSSSSPGRARKCDGVMVGSKDSTEDDRVCSKRVTNGVDNQISDHMSRDRGFENI